MQNETAIERGTRIHNAIETHYRAHPTTQAATLHSCMRAVGCVSEPRANQRIWWRAPDGTERTGTQAQAWEWLAS